MSAVRLTTPTFLTLVGAWAVASALSALLVLAPVVEAREPTATEQFAFNVFLKRLTFGDHPKTSYLEGTWEARCKRVNARRPTATCSVSWDSDHAHWTAKARFRGAVKIGPPFRRFTWRFRATSTCVGDSCEALEEDQQVRHYTWKGTGINTPA